MLLLRLSALLADKDLAVALFDAPRVDWTERRGAQGFAGAKIEAGVMPGTSHRIVDNEALRERTIVVGALSADRENVSAAAHEQNRVLSDMADQLAAVWQFGGREFPAPDRGRPVAACSSAIPSSRQFSARVLRDAGSHYT